VTVKLEDLSDSPEIYLEPRFLDSSPEVLIKQVRVNSESLHSNKFQVIPVLMIWTACLGDHWSSLVAHWNHMESCVSAGDTESLCLVGLDWLH
jgi:hypothetical protein